MLAAPLQHDQAARIARIQAASTGVLLRSDGIPHSALLMSSTRLIEMPRTRYIWISASHGGPFGEVISFQVCGRFAQTIE
jgi:hypothetical protein